MPGRAGPPRTAAAAPLRGAAAVLLRAVAATLLRAAAATLLRRGAATLLAAWGLAAAAAPPAPAGPRAAEPVTIDPAAPRGFLWEARKGEQRVLLYGTIHVGTPSMWPPPPVQAERFAEAEVIALEADPTDARRGLLAIHRYALYPADERGLDRRLPAALRIRVESRLAKMGLTTERAWRMKPWMLAQTLLAVEALNAGFSPAYSAEAHLIGLAQSRGRPMEEIEGVEAQLALFDAVPDARQHEMLAQLLDQIDAGESQRELRRLVQAWIDGDAAAIQARVDAIRASTQPIDAFTAGALLESRHPAMVDFIERAAASRRLYLVAVGAMHYFGPHGLLELLRSRSWAIAPIR